MSVHAQKTHIPALNFRILRAMNTLRLALTGNNHTVGSLVGPSKREAFRPAFKSSPGHFNILLYMYYYRQNLI